jgi:tetratricopeptide (TPR) repeat protein
MAAYTLGRYYLDKNQDSAKKYLHLAKELDFLRFRAPEKINEIIGSLAKKYDSYLVDMNNVFSAHSPQNVIGDELMTEHVHPNVKGQFLMADAFYNKIKELNFLNDWYNYIDFKEAFQDIPITEIDSIKGKIVIEDLKKSWPYDLNMSGTRPMATYIANPTYEETKALNIYRKSEPWDQVMGESYRRYESDKDYNKALHVAQSLIFEYPEQGEVYRMAGNMCLNMNDLEKAAYYFLKCNKLEKSSLSARQLASVYLKLNNIELARKTLKEAKKRGFNDAALNKMIREIN